jgi:Transcriptional regulator
MRMENAFFEALETTPFQKVTIRQIIESAGVNRNSFYYHYTDLDDLAHSAVTKLRIPEIPRLIASGFGLDSEQVYQVVSDATAAGRFRKMSAVVGPNSTSELRGILKEVVMELWLEEFGLRYVDLEKRDILTIHYALGGLFELITRVDTKNLFLALMEVRDLPIIASSVHITMKTLESAKQRVTADNG